jgi:predicted enzyme related to lactoylglutathione lyase
MRGDGKIDFVEFPGANLSATKRFYAGAFGWRFRSRSEAYAEFENEGADGGFAADPAQAPRAPMVVLYAHDLEDMRERVRAAGGVITRDIHDIPGGRRFQFLDPAGNELAVWSEVWIPVYPPAPPRFDFLRQWREALAGARLERLGPTADADVAIAAPRLPPEPPEAAPAWTRPPEAEPRRRQLVVA